MYPICCRSPARASNLPRACGDVPQPRLCAVELHTFTPRLRGCTFWRSVAPIFRGIYPAPAGIYPLRSTSVSMACDLPRACGDVPISIDPAYKEQGFTPRLRGCTQERRASDFAAAIYPAPAGMYPTIPITMASSIYLPRACGGVPTIMRAMRHACGFTPRLRGCTSIAKGGGPNQLAIHATWGCSYATPAKFANTITPRRCG